MVAATSINTLQTRRTASRSSFAPPVPDHKTKPRSCEGSIAIRMELSGLMSVAIIAHDSAMEERLSECLRTASPFLAQLREIVASFACEDGGRRSDPLMASRYRKIDPRIWTDEKFRRLTADTRRNAELTGGSKI